MELAKTIDKNDNIIVTLSGRGDKDVEVVQQYLKIREREKCDKEFTTEQSE
jgi:tryptophan synthase beta subunit